MLIAVISGPSYKQAQEQLVRSKLADGVEFRLDLFEEIDFEKIGKLQERAFLPVIFTLRKSSHGGQTNIDEAHRLEILKKLATLSPAFLDIEYDTDERFIKYLSKNYPQLKLISSYHNFKEGIDPFSLVSRMSLGHFAFYKIAITPPSSIETLKVLKFMEDRIDKRINVVCMGKYGKFARILLPIFGGGLNYAYVEESMGGGISLDDLLSTYNFRKVDRSTKIFGLIGDPVDKSIGHIFHNREIGKLKRGAIYVKIPLKKRELKEFFKIVKKLPIGGLSVTSPLKEEVIEYLDELEGDTSRVRVVNTIKLEGGRLIGYNTDGKAAVDLLSARIDIKDKKIAIIGAGGAARAIAFEANKRGGKISIFNRSLEKACNLARTYGQRGHSLERLKDVNYEILVNATPLKKENLLRFIRPGSIVMDIAVGSSVEDVTRCQYISWRSMYERQARMQMDIWKGYS